MGICEDKLNSIDSTVLSNSNLLNSIDSIVTQNKILLADIKSLVGTSNSSSTIPDIKSLSADISLIKKFLGL